MQFSLRKNKKEIAKLTKHVIRFRNKRIGQMRYDRLQLYSVFRCTNVKRVLAWKSGSAN